MAVTPLASVRLRGRPGSQDHPAVLNIVLNSSASAGRRHECRDPRSSAICPVVSFAGPMVRSGAPSSHPQICSLIWENSGHILAQSIRQVSVSGSLSPLRQRRRLLYRPGRSVTLDEIRALGPRLALTRPLLDELLAKFRPKIQPPTEPVTPPTTPQEPTAPGGRQKMISQIPPKIAEDPTLGTRMGSR